MKFAGIFGLLCILMSSFSFAVDGRVPIYSTIDISAPGHYYLTRDFAYTGGDAIDVMCNDVTIDLNGHTVTGNGVYGGIDITGRTNITIFNGTLKNFGKGVNQNSTTRGRFNINNINILNSVDYGVFIMAAEYIEITDCVIADTGGEGIHVSGYSEKLFGSVCGNAVLNSGEYAVLLLNISSAEIRGNKIETFGSSSWASGLFLGKDPLFDVTGEGNILDGNNIQNGLNGSYGICLWSHTFRNIIKNNTSCDNTGDGMHVNSDACLISGNISSNNGMNGIQVSGLYNLIENNNINLNQEHNLYLTPSNYFRSNILTNGINSGGTDAGGNIIE